VGRAAAQSRLRVEWRELRASDFGAPTSRKRLFVIARCDGQPIVWPSATHGKQRRAPYQTAAECIDFSLPVPSIFLTPAQAKAWGKAHGVAAPKRPLALRRCGASRAARAVRRRVAGPVHHPAPSEPLTTIRLVT
jgi:DNA (cytosine-5)-methyltransferase 1